MQQMDHCANRSPDLGKNSFFPLFSHFSWDCCFTSASYRSPLSTLPSLSYNCMTFIGTSFYNFAGLQNLGYHWHPAFSECEAEWISRTGRVREKKQQRRDRQDHYKELTAPLTTWNTRQQMDEMIEYYTVLVQRHLKTFMKNIHRSPKRALANLYLKYKTRIHVGFFTKQLSIFCKMMHISKWKEYSHVDSLEEKA